MDTASETALVIKAIAPSTPCVPSEADDRSERRSSPESAGRRIMRWLVDAVLLAGAAAASADGWVWWDPATFPDATHRPRVWADSESSYDRAVPILAEGRAARARSSRTSC